ncbi:four helix bundle protein [Alienimonas sp. DA493]|uniref:four helix bundle protein n=1 Tax=Alienimonas sp. DA493 TaxID=3373605 RepID=UPI003754E876
MVRRTKAFAVRVVKLTTALPNNRQGNAIGGQLIRSGTSVGANYRAARRARSTAEFRAKLGIVEEEADESAFWLEMVMETGLLPRDRVLSLHREAEEITAIVVASIRTSKRNGGKGHPADRPIKERPR